MQILTRVPDEVTSKFYGCGAPLPLGIDGLHVLDLGSGSGRDCYVCSALVGPHGSVTGVDMTDEQNEVSVGVATEDLHSLSRGAASTCRAVLVARTINITAFPGSRPARSWHHRVLSQVAQRNNEAYSRQLGHKSSNMRFVTGHIEYLDR
jgi:SAM-dependent methyltransferase